jgi:hypothetical protein
VGGELLSSQPAQTKTYGEIFDECFPFYLAIGMSYAEYWAGEPSLARYYRKAYKIKQEQDNNNAWLQGLYFYDAISTALHNAMRGLGKSKPPAKDYAKQPYDIFKKKKTELELAQEVEIEQQKAAAWMENLVMSQSHRAKSQK